MRTKKLGYSNLNLSVIGLGAWAIGGGGYSYGWGQQDDNESIATIRTALEEGVNWIDTAPVYGLGRSEKVVGRAIEGLRDKVVVATKCGLLWDKKGDIYGHLKKETIRQEVENSLKRLNIDIIDLYQIHWPDPDEDIEEAWSTVADLVKEGKIRYGGVSNFSVGQLKRIQPIHPVASLQPPYNMIRRGVEKELLQYCKNNNIGIIIYSPLASGLLTGKFTKENVKNLPEDDWRKTKDTDFQEPVLSTNLDLIEGLRRIAQKNNRTVAQLAIAWTLKRLEVTAAIVGARHPAQIKETALSGEWILSEEDISAVEVLLNERKKALSFK